MAASAPTPARRHHSFIVEKGTPGFIIEREIPMLGGGSTYEIVFEDCRIPADSVLGEVGKGYAPMQLRLRTRRLEWIDLHRHRRRARDVMCEHAKQRETFGSSSPSARRSSGDCRYHHADSCVPADGARRCRQNPSRRRRQA